MALPYDPNFRMAIGPGLTPIEKDQEHDSSASAAVVAVDLISSARLAPKLNSVYTEYSAQYLVDNARTKERGMDLTLTVKDYLEFALNKGIPKAEDLPELGSEFTPSSSYKPALVSMKGEVIEAKNMEEACDLLLDQPVGAKPHVFSPQIDLVGDFTVTPSGENASYVGLRHGIIVGGDKIQGKSIATVKLWYKKQFRFVKVALSRMFLIAAIGKNAVEPTGLLVDFCVPRLSVN